MNNQNWSLGSKSKAVTLFAACALMPAIANAHHLPGTSASFVSGAAHPWLGLDHVLAMVAVGIWAAQLGGRSLWAVPTAFVTLMALGGTVGMMGLALPGVESVILISVVALGLLIATAARLPLVASMALVGLFAIFHGHAHGTEVPAAASSSLFGIGFIASTIALHACGLGLGLIARKPAAMPALRFAGAAIALCGLCLWVG